MGIKWHFANTFSELELCVKSHCNNEEFFYNLARLMVDDGGGGE